MAAAGLITGFLGAAALAGIGYVISRKLAKIGLVIDQSFATFGDWPHLNEEMAGDREIRGGDGDIAVADRRHGSHSHDGSI